MIVVQLKKCNRYFYCHQLTKKMTYWLVRNSILLRAGSSSWVGECRKKKFCQITMSYLGWIDVKISVSEKEQLWKENCPNGYKWQKSVFMFQICKSLKFYKCEHIILPTYIFYVIEIPVTTNHNCPCCNHIWCIMGAFFYQITISLWLQ